MKYSIFNSELLLSKRITLLYNTLYDKYLIVQNGLYDEKNVDVKKSPKQKNQY